MVKIRKMISIYFKLLNQQLKAILEYQADFWIGVLAAVFTQGLGFIFLWTLYNQIPDIEGWGFWEVCFIYAMVFFTEGFVSLFFEGIWSISRYVNKGELDRFLLRPISPILQIMGSAIGVNGIGNLLIGVIIIFNSLQNIDLTWTFGKVLLLILMLISAVIIRLSIYFIACCSVFWTHSPGNAFANMVHTSSEFVKYPITIYSLGIQLFMSILIPFAFVSFFPSIVLFDKDGWGYIPLLTPIVAGYCLIVSLFVFRKGLKRYESTGH